MEILTVWWGSQGPNGYLLLSRLARDADNASANDPKNEFDA